MGPTSVGPDTQGFRGLGSGLTAEGHLSSTALGEAAHRALTSPSRPGPRRLTRSSAGWRERPSPCFRERQKQAGVGGRRGAAGRVSAAAPAAAAGRRSPAPSAGPRDSAQSPHTTHPGCSLAGQWPGRGLLPSHPHGPLCQQRSAARSAASVGGCPRSCREGLHISPGAGLSPRAAAPGPRRRATRLVLEPF